MATPPNPTRSLPPKETLLAQKTYIERVITQSCRKSSFSSQEAEDFGQHVMVKLVDDDYGVIRKFRGDNGATLRTYLAFVIKRMLLDYQDHIWGKYRPSAEAKKLGPIAVRLEMLLVRDKCSFEEACEILRINEEVEMSVGELDELHGKLPHRVPRQEDVGEDSLDLKPSRELPPDQQLLEKEREMGRRRIYMRLKQALDTLPGDDQLLVKLWVKFSIADIARIRKVEQKPLYRRMDKILKALGTALKSHGVRREEVMQLLGPLGNDLNTIPEKSNGKS